MNNYYRSYNHREGFGFTGWLTIICLIICLFVIGTSLYRPFNKISNMRDITVTVTDKVVKNYSDDSKYLIFTEDANGEIYTFEITDSILYGRFDSSDVYAAIKIDNTYTFTVGGSRNEFMSWYPNIYEYKLVKNE